MGSDQIQGNVLAVETHSGGKWNFIILLALMGPLVAAAFLPHGVPWPLVIAGAVGVLAFAVSWKGFQYRFLSGGVEVRMLGFRLNSIPTQAILSYAVEPWPWIRGRGIRGWHKARAYVWSNRVVHIRTSDGDIYLGHDDPERLVRDLNQVTGFVTRS